MFHDTYIHSDPSILTLLGIKKVVFLKFLLHPSLQTGILSKRFIHGKGGFLGSLEESIYGLRLCDNTFVLPVGIREIKEKEREKQHLAGVPGGSVSGATDFLVWVQVWDPTPHWALGSMGSRLAPLPLPLA